MQSVFGLIVDIAAAIRGVIVKQSKETKIKSEMIGIVFGLLILCLAGAQAQGTNELTEKRNSNFRRPSDVSLNFLAISMRNICIVSQGLCYATTEVGLNSEWATAISMWPTSDPNCVTTSSIHSFNYIMIWLSIWWIWKVNRMTSDISVNTNE